MDSTSITDSDWKSWRIFVLKELERLSCNYDTIHTRIELDEKTFAEKYNTLESRINYLEWKSGILGTIGGSVATLIMLLLIHVKII